MARFMLLSRLGSEDLDEVSGMTPSREPGTLWLHNDSGDGPFLYAAESKTGKLRAIVKVRGAKSEDWEGLTRGPGGFLYVADIGDNDEERREVVIYRLKEPQLPLGRGAKLYSGAVQAFPLVYPDRPHNAEALLCHPKTGALYVLTKEKDGASEVFLVPSLARPGVRQVLRRVGRFRLPAPTSVDRSRKGIGLLVTDGAISPDVREVAVATYSRLLLYAVPPGKPLEAALSGRPRSFALPAELEQCEALCYAPDGKTILLTGEGEGAPLYAFTRG